MLDLLEGQPQLLLLECSPNFTNAIKLDDAKLKAWVSCFIDINFFSKAKLTFAQAMSVHSRIMKHTGFASCAIIMII